MTRGFVVMLLLMSGIAPVPAADLGRLFFRAEERAALDAARETAAAPHESAAGSERPESEAPEEIPEAEAAPAEAVSVEGYVLRRRGDGTAWVNGRRTDQEEFAAGAGPRPALGLARDGVVVEAADGGHRRLVKPGQSYDPGQDRLREAYQGARAGHAAP